jgi:hypothetical protein
MFNMYFTGLCLLTPSKVPSPADRMRVLLPDTTRPSGGTNMVHEPHEPVLITRFDDVGSGRVPDLTFLTPTLAKRAIFLLRDQELTIPNLGLGPVSFTDKPQNNCSVIGNYSEVSWVAHLAKVSAGNAIPRDACFLPYPNADPWVAARVRMHKGDLSTAQIARDYAQKLVKWDFKIPADGVLNDPRSLADLVVLARPDVTGTVTLQTAPIRKPTTPYLRYLYPSTTPLDIGLTSSAGPLEIIVANIPLVDAMSLRPDPTPGPRDDDFHFDYYYEMIVPSGNRNIPTQVDICKDDGQPSIRSPQCPPALSAPNANA